VIQRRAKGRFFHLHHNGSWRTPTPLSLPGTSVRSEQVGGANRPTSNYKTTLEIDETKRSLIAPSPQQLPRILRMMSPTNMEWGLNLHRTKMKLLLSTLTILVSITRTRTGMFKEHLEILFAVAAVDNENSRQARAFLWRNPLREWSGKSYLPTTSV
jgi:hypothetical protein